MIPVPRRVRGTHRLLGLALLVALGLAAAACQGSGAAPSDKAIVVATPPATVAPTPSVAAVPTAIASRAGGSPSLGAINTIVIDDPDLRMTLPAGWAEYPVSSYRFLIDSVAKSSSPEVKAILEQHLKAIDAGAVRLTAGGPTEGAGGTLIIQVDSGDRSLEAAVARLGQFGSMLTDASSVVERPVSLSIGESVRRVETHPVAPGSGSGAVPARTVEYIARLDDGRTVWILATGPEADAGFEALIDASVMTIERR